jgi:pimeloyl-ACP methyl ester carboxylesterase
MAKTHTVVAPDLFGCGDSTARPAADYSLGGHAGVLRDLLDVLGIEEAVIVGHSLGGGIALEFTYLFPDRVRALVLVASGGLGSEVNVLLRAPTLPGAGWVLPVLASGFARRQGNALARGLRFVGVRGSTDVAEAWHGFEQLADDQSRRAFLATIRAVVGPDGQRVSATALLPMLHLPVLLVWGDRDRMIPVAHAKAALEQLPNGRLVVFEGAGHFPHLDQPTRFAELMSGFAHSIGQRQAS